MKESTFVSPFMTIIYAILSTVTFKEVTVSKFVKALQKIANSNKKYKGSFVTFDESVKELFNTFFPVDKGAKFNSYMLSSALLTKLVEDKEVFEKQLFINTQYGTKKVVRIYSFEPFEKVAKVSKKVATKEDKLTF
jgi:hypothetical protein